MRENPIARLLLSALLGTVMWIAGAAAGEGEIQCLCRYAGVYYAQGDCVCMTSSSGERLACCDRVLNNSSWNFVADGCDVARDEARPAQIGAAPDGAADPLGDLLGAPLDARDHPLNQTPRPE